jgi:protein XagA
MRAAAWGLVAATLSIAGPALAGPWTLPQGQGQVILKAETLRANDGFDENGDRVTLPGERRDHLVGALVEYGLTERLTLQFKGDWQWGEDALFDYEGRGPAEVGVTWQAWRGERGAVSLYGGYADAGEGRNAGYAPPGLGRRDWEARVSAGRSFDGAMGLPVGWGPQRSFVDVQLARLLRDDLPDETRLDATLGGHFGEDWMVLGQAFAGQSDDGPTWKGARWLSLESSIVRHQGPWSFQAGWREAVAGRSTPRASGPVLAIWRRF